MLKRVWQIGISAWNRKLNNVISDLKVGGAILANKNQIITANIFSFILKLLSLKYSKIKYWHTIFLPFISNMSSMYLYILISHRMNLSLLLNYCRMRQIIMVLTKYQSVLWEVLRHPICNMAYVLWELESSTSLVNIFRAITIFPLSFNAYFSYRKSNSTSA